MDLAITKVPLWVSVSFILSFSTLPIFLIANAIKNSNTTKSKKYSYNCIIFYLTYFLIVSTISLTGYFTVNTLPPRILIYTAIPLLLFYFFYVQKSKWFKIIFPKIRIEDLIYIHLFRFVGVFFLINYYYKVLPKEFAFIGGIGDILTATLVIPVLFYLQKNSSYIKIIVKVWNTIGLLDILSVITTAIIITKKSLNNNETGLAQFGTFPFSLIPAFAPATIIFLHILIFKKIKELKR